MYPTHLSISNCAKGPSQGGLPVAELKELAKQMGINPKLTKQEICNEMVNIFNKHPETAESSKKVIKIPFKVPPKETVAERLTEPPDKSDTPLVVESLRIPSSEKHINITSSNYNYNWTKEVEHGTSPDGYNLIVIPKGTILYHGGSSGKMADTLGTGYYGTLSTTSHYSVRAGSDGKIIMLEAIRNIYLLDMTKPENYVILRRNQTIPPWNPKYAGDILDYAFKDGTKRFSDPNKDKIFTKWICELSMKGIDGWAITQMLSARGRSGTMWPDEILLCNPKEVIKRIPPYLKYDMQQDSFFLIDEDKIISNIPRKEIDEYYEDKPAL